jgi:hypothetical protein
VSVLDGGGNVAWHKKAVGEYIIDDTFLSSGVEGEINYNIITNKADSASEVFTFADQWQIFDGENNLIETINGSTISYIPSSENRSEIIISPVFTSVPRKYTLTFNLPNNEVITEQAEYNTTVLDFAPINVSKNDSDLPIDETYRFNGWSLRADGSTVINNSVVVQGEMTLYAVFERISVR